MRTNQNGSPGPSHHHRIDSNSRIRAFFSRTTDSTGRHFVIIAIASITVLWALLYGVFHTWRAGYHERAQFGAQEIAPLVSALAQLKPPNIHDNDWAEAIADTRSMLEQLTASGAARWEDLKRWKTLVQQRVIQSQPETATRELAELWADAAHEGGPAISNVKVPGLLTLAVEVNPLEFTLPEDVAPASWKQALSETRAMLVAIAGTHELDSNILETLRAETAQQARSSRPQTACGILAEIWARAATAAPATTSRFTRPALLSSCSP